MLVQRENSLALLRGSASVMARHSCDSSNSDERWGDIRAEKNLEEYVICRKTGIEIIISARL